MSRWWRAYEQAVDDPKLQLLPLALFKAWFNLLCLASANDGRLPKVAAISFKLRVPEDKARHIVAELTARGLFDETADGCFTPHNWDARQFKSDVSTERVKRFRVGKRNVSPTVSETPPETETETETETEKKDSVANATADVVVDEDPKAKLFRIGKTLLASFGVVERRTGSLIGQWLKQNPDPIGLLAAIQFARDQSVAEPVAYISTLLQKQGKPNGYGRKSLSDVAFELADEVRERERSAGLFRPSDDVGSR